MHFSIADVRQYLQHLQDDICQHFTQLEGGTFDEDNWQYQQHEGGGRTRVFSNGRIFEKGGVNFSHIKGKKLPSAATNKRPELAGKNFEALGVSLVMHPDNPFVPISHMNVRFFVAGTNTPNPVWWFGGGFDMTPFYGFTEDCQYWHNTALSACKGFTEHHYDKYKQNCDEYFYLPHRQEQRGIGGLFFDDINTPDFTQSFAFTQSVGNHYIKAYLPIVEKRKDTPFSTEHKQWQNIRRGRYVEFNLVCDRGTLFGLQSNGRTESILMSMPPVVHWQYQHNPKSGSAEAKLLSDFLPRKNWL